MRIAALIAFCWFAIGTALAIPTDIDRFNEILQQASQAEQEGDLATAIEKAQVLQTLSPDDPDVFFWLARLQRDHGAFEAAILSYQRGILLDSDQRPQAMYNLAVCHQRWSADLAGKQDYAGATRQLQRSLALLERLAAEKTTPKEIKVRDALKTERGQLAELNAASTRQDRIWSDQAVGRAQVWFDQGKPVLAERELLNAIDLNPGNAMAYKDLGRCLAAQQRFDAAVAACRKALELQPDFKEVHSNLGLIYDEMNLHSQAIESLNNALKIDAGYGAALFNLGLSEQVAGQLDAAMSAYERCVKIDPNHGEAWFNLAGLHLVRQEYENALACARRARDARPGDARTHSLLGDVLTINGLTAEAARAFGDALFWSPDDEHAREGLKAALEARDTSVLDRYYDGIKPALPAPANGPANPAAAQADDVATTGTIAVPVDLSGYEVYRRSH